MLQKLEGLKGQNLQIHFFQKLILGEKAQKFLSHQDF